MINILNLIKLLEGDFSNEERCVTDIRAGESGGKDLFCIFPATVKLVVSFCSIRFFQSLEEVSRRLSRSTRMLSTHSTGSSLDLTCLVS